MHDPLVVAFTIRRPWPQRTSMPASGSHQDGVRWRIRLHHDCVPGCEDNGPHRSGAFPWWKPSSYMTHWRVAGREFYWPSLITVWHREPDGQDSGEVCKHYRRVFDEATRVWSTKFTSGWKWHIRHWKIQVHPAQALRRWALTRCSWCGGRSHKGDRVNFSHQWDGPRGRWWRGEPGLFHHDCSSVERAHSLCFCESPLLHHGDYGKCLVCGKFRAWHKEPDEADRLLAAIPRGGRITPDIRPAVEAAWAERRARKAAT